MAVRFDVITLFPELFAPFQQVGVTRRAFETRAVDVRLWPLRDHAEGVYRRVDDRPFGGGPGMVMLVEPLVRCLSAIRASQSADAHAHADAAEVDAARPPRLPVIWFSPAGQRLTQQRVQKLAAGPGAVLVCGRYEGVDQRFIDARVTHEISLGDYVLSGGELAALVLLDAVARLQEGVLKAPSHELESFGDGLLEAPSYTRPECLSQVQGGAPVPAVLLSGDHARIARWRREQSLALTARRRPDLLVQARTQGLLSPADEKFLRELEL